MISFLPNYQFKLLYSALERENQIVSPMSEPKIRNPPKMMTTGVVKIDPWMRKVATSSPEIAQPMPKINAPIQCFVLNWDICSLGE